MVLIARGFCYQMKCTVVAIHGSCPDLPASKEMHNLGFATVSSFVNFERMKRLKLSYIVFLPCLWWP